MQEVAISVHPLAQLAFQIVIHALIQPVLIVYQDIIYQVLPALCAQILVVHALAIVLHAQLQLV